METFASIPGTAAQPPPRARPSLQARASSSRCCGSGRVPQGFAHLRPRAPVWDSLKGQEEDCLLTKWPEAQMFRVVFQLGQDRVVNLVHVMSRTALVFSEDRGSDDPNINLDNIQGISNLNARHLHRAVSTCTFFWLGGYDCHPSLEVRPQPVKSSNPFKQPLIPCSHGSLKFCQEHPGASRSTCGAADGVCTSRP